jgi:dTDP-4-amino-4,6-dideoxygalactose transaminase
MKVTSRSTFLAYHPPLIGEEEIAEVVDTLRSDWITTGPKTALFERDFASYVSAPGALALNSCTAGLHLALAVKDIGEGDEVVTTTMTFAATANVIEHVGARPVLVDIEPDTLNIDPDQVARAITPRTKAIIAVHYGGHPAELDDLRSLAALHSLTLIEDAAHAVPASYRGQPIGSGSNPVSFSFYATKNMTTGEGGMLTGDPEFLSLARMASLHGMDRNAWKRYNQDGHWAYDVVFPGFKYNMTDIQAAIGIWQLRKLASFQQRRVEIVRAYNEAFAAMSDYLELPVERPHVEHSWHLYALRLRLDALRIGRDQFIDEMKSRLIGCAVHYTPLHRHPFYRDKYGLAPTDFPVADDSFNRVLSLPLNLRMNEQDVYDVVEAVQDVVCTYRR